MSEHAEAIYHKRAARLAQPAASGAPADGRPVLVFRLGEERFGIELGEVLEVIGAADYAPVPGARPELAGVMNLRGEIRPVWDLKRLLRMPEAPAGAASLILLRGRGRAAGLLVGRVEEIRNLRSHEWAPARTPCAKGATAELLLVLDPQELLKEEFS